MKITEENINYIDGLPCEAKLYEITRTHPHSHPTDLELIYCLRGNVSLVAGHQHTVIGAGEIFSVDCRDIHYLYSHEENVTLLFHLDLTSLHIDWELLENAFFACESSHCRPYQQKALDNVKDIVLSLSYQLFKGDIPQARRKQMSAASDELIDVLMRYFNWFSYENFDEHLNMEQYDRFYRILSYCCENYPHKITISQLAEMEHINKTYVSQFIRKTVFESFSAMVRYVRCYEAERLLLNTSLPVSEISYACGFSDPKYFYSAFKQFWRCTPTEHRQKYARYMEQEPHAVCLLADESLQLTEDAITAWHLEKTFRG